MLMDVCRWQNCLRSSILISIVCGVTGVATSKRIRVCSRPTVPVWPNLPKRYDIKCLIWHQGESDQKAGDRYYDNLKAVIQHIRQHLYKVTGKKKYRRLPVICGTYAKDSRQCSQQVVDALYRLERDDKNFHVVDASDLPLLRDRLHFNAQGAQTLGQRIYEILKTQ